ncbi:MAG: CRISPR-associated endonuclease Cas2 [Desulfobacterales bacterium]|nr:CRISPR-associated endonuclease Cas2 [Desulfobacterales bacterium]
MKFKEDWWFDAFPVVPYPGKPPGAREMLYLVAYDISEPKRLHRVAKLCEDHGVRVQYSLFECPLEPDVFKRFWMDLLGEIDASEDRVVAYPMDARCVRDAKTAGTMVCSERVVCYLV